MLKGEIILQERGAKSGQTGELLSTSLAFWEHVPLALGFPFSDCIKKSLEKVICWPLLYLFCTSGVDLVIYHSANVSGILWRDFWGVFKLPTGQAVYCRFHVLHGLTRDKRNTEPLPFSTPIFCLLLLLYNNKKKKSYFWRKVKLPLSIVLRFLLGQPVHLLKLCSYSGCFEYWCIQRFRDLLGFVQLVAWLMLCESQRRALFGSWLLNDSLCL